ncbi:hypothetical protein ABHN11_24795 [Brevibacillus centrosporus]|uniref:hypothetical protein n=1 Tax=Brevibacillus centrosporus TaxID=54910 RepID=UPI003D21D9C1
MDKDLLLENIRKTYEKVSEIEKLQEEWVSYHKKPIDLSKKMHGLVIFLLWVSTLILAFAWPIFVYYYNKRKLKQKLKNNASRMLEISEITKRLIAELEVESIIPQDYWNTHALIHFQKYLTNKRAENFKECANLYELERQHSDKMREIKEIQKQQKEIQKEIMINTIFKS